LLVRIQPEEPIRTLWPDSFVEENNLIQQISQLRRALGEGTDAQSYIETVPKLGYRFLPEVRQIIQSEGGPMASKRIRTQIVPREVEEADEDESTRKTRDAPFMRAGWLAKPRVMALAAVGTVVSLAFVYLILTREPIPIVVDSQRLARIEGAYFPLYASSTDIYFNGQQSIMRLPIGGADPVEVVTPIPSPMLADFSRKRSEFLLLEGRDVGDRPLWILPAPSGSPRRLGEVRAHAAAWSPDGDRIVYAAGRDLFLVNRQGDASQKLGSNVGWPLYLRWSPDGRVIRFVGNDTDTNTFSLWQISAKGSIPERLLSAGTNAQLIGGEWSPDGKYFFYSYYGGDRTDIWALRETQSALASLLTPSGGHLDSIQVTKEPVGLYAPLPVLDRKKLLAVAKIEQAQLVRYDPASRSFHDFLNGISADGLAFSPDGLWVAYAIFPERTLWRSRLDGSARQQLTFAPTEALLPRWSPDGQTIAFMARRPGEPWQICLIPGRGGNPQPLTPSRDDQANPSWSRDGHSLAFAGTPWLKGWEPDSTSIHILDLQTSQVRILPRSEGLWSPRWSLDGRWLVAETVDSKRLLLYNGKSATWSPLTSTDSGQLGYSAWSHDSRYVYFNLLSADEQPTYRVSVPDGQRELIVRPDGVRLKDSLGKWFGLTPDDQLLFLHDQSAEEIYALTLAYR
jgi:Tol biopolymer transport system component